MPTIGDAPRHSFRTVQHPFTYVQWATVAGAFAVLLWSVPGIIVNPDFATGDAATAERVLGVDMNGWHAVSGFLVAIPALLVASRPRLAALYITVASFSLIATGVWALFSTQVAGGLFAFPNNGTDAALHFATSTIWLSGAAHYYLVEQRRPAAAHA
jgi:hypothetical protein